ncbi:MAG: hypothetical protein KIS76_00030 [Pyrinomonadaceae bacterium]|nr:hypothetical protein [Pyrinomonadaceae bacterium]
MKVSDDKLKEFIKITDRDDFAAQVNSMFRVNQNVDAKLVEVSEAKKTSNQERFSMFFLFPHDFPPVQNNYIFDHPELGSRELFVVPVEDASDGIVFEAVFNRLLPKN